MKYLGLRQFLKALTGANRHSITMHCSSSYATKEFFSGGVLFQFKSHAPERTLILTRGCEGRGGEGAKEGESEGAKERGGERAKEGGREEAKKRGGEGAKER